ncbi:MAG: Oligopeptide transport system permease protein, partial [Verrucomicrobiaceae bacterium]|nr:Oligopeptide transport system permease protein [Verrucomicrobiaceae bacterium]
EEGSIWSSMLRFLIGRIVQSIAVVTAVLIITFGLMKAAPGGPFSTERSVSAQTRANLDAYYGLDRPWYVQLGRHLWKFATLQFPDSYRFKGRGVGEIIAESFPVSAKVGCAALMVSLILGIPVGAIAGLRPHSMEDRVAMGAATLGVCMPSLVLGPVMAMIFALKLHWFNVGGWESADDWVLPAITLGLIYSAYVARLVRGGLREVLVQDFIRTARAKGAGEAAIVMRHALKLACMPLLNYMGPVAAGLLTGSFVTETVFYLPGLGQHYVSAAANKDYTLAMAVGAFYAALICLFNLLVDVVQALLNPRIGFK